MDLQQPYSESQCSADADDAGLLAQDRERKIAKGWTRYGNDLVPPGWVPGADWVEPPEDPPNLCEADRLGLTYRPTSA